MLSREHVVMITCLHVLIFTCRHSLVLTDLKRRGACNQGRKVQGFYYSGVTRRHSFGECLLKKKPVKQRVSFHKPNQGCRQVRLLNIGLMEQRLFFLLVWQLQYQHHTFLTVFEHGRKLV